jgi:hypothetical protein
MFALTIVLIVFFVVLTVFTAIGAYNKIKERRYIGQDIEIKNTISVTGNGEIYAKPDLALITFSVTNEAKTVAQAMAENSQKMNAVIGLIKAQGVEDKDLKTIGFNIFPRYEYKSQETIESWPPYPEGTRVLVGYEITQSLEVKIRDMEKIGDIIELSTAAGANQVGNLYFIIDDQDALEKQAREQAIDKAKSKARELASQLGINLVRIQNFSESGSYPRPLYYDYSKEALPVGAGGAAPSIETGENKIEVTVIITYEID